MSGLPIRGARGAWCSELRWVRRQWRQSSRCTCCGRPRRAQTHPPRRHTHARRSKRAPRLRPRQRSRQSPRPARACSSLHPALSGWHPNESRRARLDARKPRPLLPPRAGQVSTRRRQRPARPQRLPQLRRLPRKMRRPLPKSRLPLKQCPRHPHRLRLTAPERAARQRSPKCSAMKMTWRAREPIRAATRSTSTPKPALASLRSKRALGPEDQTASTPPGRSAW